MEEAGDKSSRAPGFPLCNTVGFSKIKEVRRKWKVFIEKQARKIPFKSNGHLRQEKLNWSLWGTGQQVEKQGTVVTKIKNNTKTIKHGVNLCCKLNPYLTSFLRNGCHGRLLTEGPLTILSLITKPQKSISMKTNWMPCFWTLTSTLVFYS